MTLRSATTLGLLILTARSLPAQGTPFVDMHVHLNNPAMALEIMKGGGIPHAAAFIGAGGSNETIRAAAAASGGSLFAFASVTPERREYRGKWVRDDSTLGDDLERLLAPGGYAGIGEISVVHFASEGFPEADFDPMGAAMRSIMRVADRRKLPVLIHCEVTRLRELSALLEAFPTVTVVWAHGGYTPLVLASRMLERHPNLVYELSARTWTRHPRSPDYTIFQNDTAVWREWLQLIERNPTRFVVGTDASYRSQENEVRKIERVRMMLDQLSPAIREQVAMRNALRILGRP
jgi:predicted TIM-barrel fold metal-dependent hydrolase